MYRKFGKRFFDIVVSLAALIILAPVMLIVAILIRIKLGSPVIFTQDRPGLHGKIFKMYKFRSMNDACDENGNLLPDADRLPKFGRALRATSLDELPELWNIFRGDMSVVGPRPLLVRYLPLYNDFQKRRHEVLPGLTGLAQVSGRNSISWQEKFALDIQYVDNMSFRLDVYIMFQTVYKTIKRDGISSATSETMEAFKGNAEESIIDG